MKLQNKSYANQKLQTQWGALQCDVAGVVELEKEDAHAFFVKTLKFKALEAAAPVAEVVPAPAQEAKVEEVKSAPKNRFKRGE